jgi:uncharacterized protein (DUF983 family)
LGRHAAPISRTPDRGGIVVAGKPTMPPIRWQPDRTTKPPPWPVPTLGAALGRGLMGRCPACGRGHVFDGFLRVVPQCSSCDAPLGLARADDAPPYFTILIVGHIVIPAMLIMQKLSDPPTWLLSAIFVPLTLILALGLLRPVKGATVGLMVTFNMLKSDVEPG